MYIVNIVKMVVLYGNEIIHLKSSSSDLKMYQMHDWLTFCIMK